MPRNTGKLVSVHGLRAVSNALWPLAPRVTAASVAVASFWVASFVLTSVTAFWPVDAVLADPVDVVNSLRFEGCRGEKTTGSSVARDGLLDDVARELSRTRKLENALDRHGYPAASATSYHVRGSARDGDVRNTLEARFCNSLTDARFDEAGFYQDGDETWIVLAVRVPDRPVLEREQVAARILELVNAARARGEDCGNGYFDPTHALTLSPFLDAAAHAHARDMATRGNVTHEGSDGSNVADRIARTGYAWRAAGENVAGGQQTADSAFAAWLASPGHCATLMGPGFTEMGVGFELAPDKNPDIYWAQVFAAPRETGLQSGTE